MQPQPTFKFQTRKTQPQPRFDFRKVRESLNDNLNIVGEELKSLFWEESDDYVARPNKLLLAIITELSNLGSLYENAGYSTRSGESIRKMNKRHCEQANKFLVRIVTMLKNTNNALVDEFTPTRPNQEVNYNEIKKIKITKDGLTIKDALDLIPNLSKIQRYEGTSNAYNDLLRDGNIPTVALSADSLFSTLMQLHNFFDVWLKHCYFVSSMDDKKVIHSLVKFIQRERRKKKAAKSKGHRYKPY